MRRVPFLLLAATLLSAQPPSSTTSIHGIVKDEATGLPIPNAVVHAAHRWAASEDSMILQDVGRAEVDDEGRYVFPSLGPGDYRIVANAGVNAAIRDVQLAAGQDLSVDLIIPTPCSLSGRVLDEQHKPVSGAYVRLIRSEYSAGVLRRTLIGPRIADASGAFKFGDVLEAGRAYYLFAERYAADPEKRVEAPTYYGGSTSLDAATPLVLRPGEHRVQADITLRKAKTYCVDGDVKAGGKPMTASVTIEDAALEGAGPAFNPTDRAGDASVFQTCGLTSGDYVAHTWSEGLGARSIFTIVDADVHQIHLDLDPASIRWELAWDGDPPIAPTPAPDNRPDAQPFDDKMRSMLSLPSGPQITATLVRIDERAHTRLSQPAPYADQAPAQIPAGDYTIRADVAPGSYIKEITFAGAPIHDGLLHLAPGSSGVLRIVASQGGSTISVKVTDSDGHPLPKIAVLVAPETVTSAQQFSALARRGSTDLRGNFQSPTLPPGKYRVLALSRPYKQTPEDIQELLLVLSNAQLIELSPKSNAQVILQPMAIQ